VSSSKRAYDLFFEDNADEPNVCKESHRIKMAAKITGEYASVKNMGGSMNQETKKKESDETKTQNESTNNESHGRELVLHQGGDQAGSGSSDLGTALVARRDLNGGLLALGKRAPPKVPKPTWHAPWKLKSVVSGHLGWVRCLAFEPGNQWFVTGATDRTIKVWDLAKCSTGSSDGLKLTLTGHISAVRGLAVSPLTTYMFSCAEDKMVKCWDLEQNKVVRHYHGHLSGVYAMALHPTLDLLVTAGRDSVARVWDVRTSRSVHCLAGHGNTVGAVLTNAVDPQVITGGYDNMIRTWDLAAGKCMATLTNHKKAVRCLCAHPREYSFISGAADNLKKWQTRDGKFLRNLSGHNSIVNAVAANEDGVLVSGGDNGSLHFWDYETGYNFQQMDTIVQPGSLDAEAGIFALGFDLTGSRLVTCEADKTIKIWSEDNDADEDSHPIDMKTWGKQCRQYKRY
jgi:pleiotropic regulator 1